MELISTVTDSVKIIIKNLNIDPESYRYLFPDCKYTDEIKGLIAKGAFPSLPDLAPSITYAVVLSIFRLALQIFILKVSSLPILLSI